MKTPHSQNKIHLFFLKVGVEPDGFQFGSKFWFYRVFAVFLWASHSTSLGFTFLISEMGIMLSSGGFPSLIHSTVNDEYPSQASVPHHCHGLHSDIGGSVLSRGCAWLGRNYYLKAREAVVWICELLCDLKSSWSRFSFSGKNPWRRPR